MPRQKYTSARPGVPILACSLIFALAFASAGTAQPDDAVNPSPSPDAPRPTEVWAYLLDGEERLLDPTAPVTDLAYFGAGLSSLGKLAGLPSRAKLSAVKGRVHLVIAETSSQALTHFALDPAYPLRDALVADILKAAEAFDGVQIDFEAILAADYDNFHAFLGLLKAGLGAKRLSVALPARTSEGQDKIGYERAARTADRIVVMAYDEHWSSSEPGPVASLSWCKSVSDYAMRKIGADKLVMGLPFYGRAWADRSPAKAYRFSGIAGIIAEKSIGAVQRTDSVPFFEYEETVKVKLYFEDAVSILARIDLYRQAGVRKIAFWRLGQEDPAVWKAVAAAMTATPGATAQVPTAGSLPAAGSPSAAAAPPSEAKPATPPVDAKPATPPADSKPAPAAAEPAKASLAGEPRS